MNTDLMFSSASQEWETPTDFFRKLDREYNFTLDVCATRENTKCDHYFDAAIDGLSQPWAHHVCWMNPPYGRQIRAWMRKASEESGKGATVVCLVPARTDTAWWHEYAMKGSITFLRGRITFWENGKPKLDKKGRPMPAGFPSAIVVYRPPRDVPFSER